MSNGKGSKPRPFGVPYGQYAANYDAIFRQNSQLGHAAFYHYGDRPFWADRHADPEEVTDEQKRIIKAGTKSGTKRTKSRRTKHGKRRLPKPATALRRGKRKQD